MPQTIPVPIPSPFHLCPFLSRSGGGSGDDESEEMKLILPDGREDARSSRLAKTTSLSKDVQVTDSQLELVSPFPLFHV